MLKDLHPTHCPQSWPSPECPDEAQGAPDAPGQTHGEPAPLMRSQRSKRHPLPAAPLASWPTPDCCHIAFSLLCHACRRGQHQPIWQAGRSKSLFRDPHPTHCPQPGEKLLKSSQASGGAACSLPPGEECTLHKVKRTFPGTQSRTCHSTHAHVAGTCTGI